MYSASSSISPQRRTAIKTFSFIFSIELYIGTSIVLPQVCPTGRRSSFFPLILICYLTPGCRRDRPLINFSTSCLSSLLISANIYQNMSSAVFYSSLLALTVITVDAFMAAMSMMAFEEILRFTICGFTNAMTFWVAMSSNASYIVRNCNSSNFV